MKIRYLLLLNSIVVSSCSLICSADHSQQPIVYVVLPQGTYGQAQPVSYPQLASTATDGAQIYYPQSAPYSHQQSPLLAAYCSTEQQQPQEDALASMIGQAQQKMNKLKQDLEALHRTQLAASIQTIFGVEFPFEHKLTFHGLEHRDCVSESLADALTDPNIDASTIITTLCTSYSKNNESLKAQLGRILAAYQNNQVNPSFKQVADACIKEASSQIKFAKGLPTKAKALGALSAVSAVGGAPLAAGAFATLLNPASGPIVAVAASAVLVGAGVATVGSVPLAALGIALAVDAKQQAADMQDLATTVAEIESARESRQ